MNFAASSPSRDGARLVPGAGGQVLLFSMRRLEKLVAYSMTYEFEDVAAGVTGADRIDAGDENALEFARRAYKLVRYTSGSRTLARLLQPAPSVVRLERDYDLFFSTFNHAYELFALAIVPNWRERCRVAACFIAELWMHQLPGYLLEVLADFDHVFVGMRHPVDEVARISGKPCSYLPMAADVVRFSPYPGLPARVIDVCNIGRRSAVTHEALLELARTRGIFYYYDTVAASGHDKKQRTFQVHEPGEHRLLLAQLLQHTRYYFANRARANDPDFTMGREEISGRFYEGCAAGTVMIGVPPGGEEFERQFDWPDAVIHVPFDSPDIAAVLEAMDRDPDRLARISRDNACHAALRHDWVHRLRRVFDTLGIPATAAMQEREERLRKLAAMAQAH
jgi:hypothetical protein